MLSVILLSFSLALDAVSVSIAEGAMGRENRLILGLKLALVFGLFQAGMAALGVMANGVFASGLDDIDHWIAFAIFILLGLNMLREAFDKDKKIPKTLSWKVLFLLGIATSIDALAAGLTLPMFTFPVGLSVLLIGGVTFVLCYFAAFFGSSLKTRFKKIPLEAVGGVLLIGLGISALL
ncbi:MAG: manganese efflux pump MntP family protein [Candidatus Gracilibacteria bacterium]